MDIKASILSTFLVIALLITVCGSRTCNERRARYSRQSYTSYYSRGYTQYYSCGFWGWSRCSRTRYSRTSRISYRTATSYYYACCSGYGCSSSCHACCSPSCQHGGTCDTPNRCLCQAGWSGSVCQHDVNECRGRNRCHRYAQCTNTRGSYTCTCRTGYQGNGISCTDIDECRRSNRCSRDATCRNTVGSYTCTCNSGYSGNGYTCSDINECRSGHRCHVNAACANTIGSYRCTCNRGYSGNGRYCNDVNECVRGTHRCHRQATCTNLIGSYSCSCNRGYRGNGFSCQDINECSSSNGGCGQICTNTIASYRCSCRRGYYLGLDGHTCEDVNECASRNGGCHHNCHNTIGSYHCSCNHHYELNTDSHTCQVPPLPPGNVQVSGVTTRSATVTWHHSVVTFLNDLTSISGYRVIARQTSFNISDLVVELLPTQLSYSFPSTLEEFTMYTCQVYAKNSFGYGTAGQTVQFKTLQAIPSAPPRVDSAIASSSSIILLHWFPPLSIHINGLLEYYIVNVTETNTGKKWTFIAVDSVLRLGSLHPYYVYSFSLCARTIGNGPYSPPITVRTQEEAPTSPPQLLTVVNKTSTTLALSWAPPPPSDRNGFIQLYSLFLLEMDTNQTLGVSTNATNLTVSSLHPFYDYAVKVRAMTISHGPYSENIMVQLNEDAPSSGPIITNASTINSTAILLEWIQPDKSTQNGIIRLYNILITEEESGMLLTHKTEDTSRIITLLHPYYTYKCEVQAITVKHGPSSEPEYVMTLEDVPSGAPFNLSVSERLSTSLTLTWQEPSPELQNGDITTYISVITDLSDVDFMFNVTTNETEVTVDGLFPHTNYIFKVAAGNSIGVGPFSATLLTHTAEDAPSEGPHNVTVVNTTSIYAIISWDPPSTHLHNGIIREYFVEIMKETESEVIVHRAGTTTLVIDDLHPDTSYSIRVAAHTVEVGPFSDPVHLHTLEDAPASAPVELRSISVTSTSFILLWEPPLAEDQNGVITEYMVNFTQVHSHVYTLFLTNSTSLDVTMLSPFTLYSFSVSAATALGFGPASEHFQVRSAEDVPTSAPENLTSHAVDSRSISLSWLSLPTEELNGVLRQYQIDVLEVATMRSFRVHSVENQYILSSLHPYYKYVISVAAATVGNGPFSRNITIETHPDAPSASPSISGLEATSRSITASWEELPSQERNGIITGYTVFITDLEDFDDGDALMESFFVDQSLNITIDDLVPYTTYGLFLTAHTEIGPGPRGNLSTVQTAEEAPIGRPTNITAVKFDSTSIHIYWTHPHEDTHYGFIREYRLNITEIETGQVSQMVVDSEETEVTLSSLHPYYTYHVTIVPVTIEEGENYTEITIRTEEDAPSASPVDLMISELLPRSFRLSWNSPPKEHANGIIRKYIVNITEKYGQNVLIEEFFNTTTEIPSLHPHTVYLVSVSAFTIAEGPQSPVIEVLTLEDVPSAPPLNITTLAVTPRTLHISWQPPPATEQNGIIINYTIIIEDEDDLEIIRRATGDLEILVEGLLPFHDYYVSIASSTAVGLGPYTLRYLIEMPEDAPSSPPQEVTVDEINSHNFSVQWMPPPQNTHNGVIQDYLLNVTELETGRFFLRHTQETHYVFIRLHPYYRYEFTVSAVTVRPGPSTEQRVVTTAEAPPSSSPVDVTIIDMTSRSFTLSWSPPPLEDINGVITEYSVIVSSLATLDIVPFTTNSTVLTVGDLVPYSRYEVEVAALNKEGNGPYTEVILVQTNEDAPSVPPSNLTVQEVLATSIGITWTSPEEDELNGQLTHYVVEILELDTGASTHITSILPEVVLNSLHPFYTYRIHVAAVTVSPGPHSEALEITTLEDAPTAPPMNIHAEANSSDSINIRWSPPPPDMRNGRIRQYSVVVVASQSWVNYNRTLVSYNETQMVVTELEPYITYHVRINAKTLFPGPFSVIQSTTTFESAPSVAPFNVSLSILNPSTVELTWMPPSIEDRNGIIRYYWIHIHEKNMSDAPFQLIREIRVNSSPASIADLHPSYQYQLSISAVTVHNGPFDNLTSWTMPEDAPRTPPIDIVIINITPTNFTMEWLPPSYSDRNGEISNYSIVLTDSVRGTNVGYNVSGNVTSFRFVNLHPAYLYGVRIAAVTISPGPYSHMIDVNMAEDVPSGPPTEIKVDVINSTSAQVLLDEPPKDQQNGKITSYYIVLSKNESNQLVHHNFTADMTLIDLSFLRPFSEYNIYAAANTGVGMGPFTTPFTFHTPEDAPIGSPTIISADIVTSTSFLVKWKLPHINETNGYIRYFLLNVTETETATSQSIRAVKTIKTIDDLHPFYNYTLSVAAVTTAVGPYSDIFTIRTDEAAPSAPPNSIKILAVGNRYTNVTWEPPPLEHRNGIIRFYQVSLMLNTSAAYQDSRTFRVPVSSIAISDLLPYHVYTFTITTFTVTHGPETRPFTFQTLEDVPSVSPPSFMALNVSSREFKLSWKAPRVVDTNGILRHYILAVREESASSVSPLEEFQIEAVNETSEIVVRSLNPHVVYICSVAAVTIGIGPSAFVQVLTAEEAPAQPPEGVAVEVHDSHSMTASWNPPNFQQNGIIRTYLINLTVVYEEEATYQYTSNITTIFIERLVAYRTYSIRVAAVTVAVGPYSESVYANTPETAPYSPPQNCSAKALSSTTITLTWLQPESNSINGVLRYYHVAVDDPSGYNVHNHLVDHEMLNTTVDGLHPYYLYNCTVTAVTVDKSPPASVLIKTLEDIPSESPFLVATRATNNSILLTWLPPSPENQNGIIHRYRLEVLCLNTNESQQLMANESFFEISNLHPFYSYQITIAAETHAGIGPYSSPVIQQLPPARPSRTIRNLTMTIISPSSVRLLWMPPQKNFWNGIIQSYSITCLSLGPNNMSTIDDMELILANVTLTDSVTKTFPIEGQEFANDPDPRMLRSLVPEEVLIDQLHEYFSYQFTIYMTNSAGDSDSISSSVIQLPGREPSGHPTHVEIESVSSSSLTLSWQPPEFHEWNGVITGYKAILKQLANQTTSKYEFSPDTCSAWLNCVIEDLEPYTSYSVVLAAFSSYGTGPYSDEIIIQTYEDIPGPPSNISIQTAESTALITWAAPLHPNGVILVYEVTYYEPGKDSGIHSKNTTFQSVLLINLTSTQYRLKIRAATRVGFGAYTKEFYFGLPVQLQAIKDKKSAANTHIIAPLSMGWIILIVVIIILIAVTPKLYKKYKKVNKHQLNIRVSKWISNPLYENGESVKESIMDDQSKEDQAFENYTMEQSKDSLIKD